MKVLLLIVFLFPWFNLTQQPPSSFTINVFTNVPKDMGGCGENYFLSKSDEKQERFICYTDYAQALISVNNKIYLLNGFSDYNMWDKKIRIFSDKNYTLSIKIISLNATGDEDYDIPKAIITIKYNSKIIWSKIVVGGGGC